MAKRRAEEKPKSTPEKDLLVRIRSRYKVMYEADKSNREAALEDLKFLHVPGLQWDKQQRDERGKDRPTYEFNKLRVTVKRVVNDMRANRPQFKVRGVEDNDKDTADTYEGLCRNIWTVSDGDTIADYAGEYQVGGGYGAWRINTRYSSDTAFEQDIVIEPFKNPFCLYADPSCSDPLKRDAEDWIVTEKISKRSYARLYPKAKKIDFEHHDFDDDEDWEEEGDEGNVRIAEYWYKERYEKELWLLADGATVDASDPTNQGIDPALIKRRRTVLCPKIMMCIVSGSAILEEPREWAGPDFPFVVVYGDWLVIDGKVHWSGLTRFSKDAQKSYNVSRTAAIEAIARAPTARFWATPDQAKGNLGGWAEAHKKNFPYMLYNPDNKAPGPPAPSPGADVPVALSAEALVSSEDIKATSGIFDPSLGQKSNETSGRAITARQQQGEIATFNYRDNMAKAHRRTGEILINLIPKIYDTERSVRILGIDGAEKYVKVNSQVIDPQTGQAKPVNDLSRGKYDVTVTVGPSFSTQRQEATELYTQLGTAVPAVWTVAGDLIFKSMDLPYAEQIAERLRVLLPPQIQQQIAEGKQIPPEAQAVMNQAAQAMAVVQQQSQLVQAAAQEVAQDKAESEKAQAKAQQAVSEIGVKRAEFDAHIQEQLAKLMQKELQLMQREAQVQSAGDRLSIESERQAVEGERQALTCESSKVSQEIQRMADEFTRSAEQMRKDLSSQVDQTISALMRAQPNPSG